MNHKHKLHVLLFVFNDSMILNVNLQLLATGLIYKLDIPFLFYLLLFVLSFSGQSLELK